jgi:hypothetical protein
MVFHDLEVIVGVQASFLDTNQTWLPGHLTTGCGLLLET